MPSAVSIERERTKVEEEVFAEVFDDDLSPEVSKFEEDDTEIKELADLAGETQDESRPSQLKRSVAVVVCLVVLSTGIMFFLQDLSRAPDFFEMRLEQAQEVKSFLRKQQGVFRTDDMPMFLGLSRDSHSLILATPFSGPAKLFLHLESIEGEGLFETPVIVTASAQLENYKAVFDELTWQQGRSLVPGYYHYEVSAIPTGITAQLRGALQRAGFAEDAPTPFKGSGKVLLSRWDRETFQKKWKEFQSGFLAKQQAPLEETLQRYQTLEGLADQILSLYKEILPTVEKPEDMQLFENRYSREIAGLLQVLILEAHKKVNAMKGDDSQMAKAYESLRELGKNIGGVVSDMLTTTRETPKLDDKKKARLKKMFKNRIKSLTQEAQERQQLIRDKLQELGAKSRE